VHAKIDIAKLPVDSRSTYPEPFRPVVVAVRASGSATRPLSTSSASTHDVKPAPARVAALARKGRQLVYVLEGEIVLIEDDGETVLRQAMRPASKPASATASPGQQSGATRSIWRSARARNMNGATIRMST